MTAENYSRLASTHLRHHCRTAIGTRAQRLAGYCGYDNFYPGLGKLGRLRRCRCCPDGWLPTIREEGQFTRPGCQG